MGDSGVQATAMGCWFSEGGEGDDIDPCKAVHSKVAASARSLTQSLPRLPRMCLKSQRLIQSAEIHPQGLPVIYSSLE